MEAVLCTDDTNEWIAHPERGLPGGGNLQQVYALLQHVLARISALLPKTFETITD